MGLHQPTSTMKPLDGFRIVVNGKDVTDKCWEDGNKLLLPYVVGIETIQITNEAGFLEGRRTIEIVL
jgi:hypothetical protein